MTKLPVKKGEYTGHYFRLAMSRLHGTKMALSNKFAAVVVGTSPCYCFQAEDNTLASAWP